MVPFRQETEDTSRMDYYLTQLEVLRSRGLARKTLEELHLDQVTTRHAKPVRLVSSWAH